MPHKRTGTLELIKGTKNYRGRIRLGDGSRLWVKVPEGYSEARARDWVQAIQEREDKEGLLLTKRQEAKRATTAGPGETVRQWSTRWVAARKAQGLRAADTDQGRLERHILPIIGDEPMATVGRSRIEDVRDDLDAKVRRHELRWKTAIHTWGLMTKMFGDAYASKVRPLRVREDNPMPGIKGPDRGPRTAKQFLYPSELLALVSSEEVPLDWRRAFAITTYLYLRAGEAQALRWEDVDLDHGIVHVHRSVNRRDGSVSSTKTGDERRVPIEPALLPLLEAMWKEAGGEGRVLTGSATDLKLARQLRRCLALAGVKRAALHDEGSRTTKAMTFHDLRATGLTWLAVRGDPPQRIKQRAGHRTLSTTEGYIRTAEAVGGATFGEVFPGLTGAGLWPTDWPTKGAEGFIPRGKMVEAPGIEPGRLDLSRPGFSRLPRSRAHFGHPATRLGSTGATSDRPSPTRFVESWWRHVGCGGGEEGAGNLPLPPGRSGWRSCGRRCEERRPFLHPGR